MISLATVDWAALREWLIAAGTIGAAIAAVWIGALRPRWRRPKLSAHFDSADSRDARVAGLRFVQPGQPGSEYNTRGAYARLRVGNASGRDTAEEVEVFVEKVEVLEAPDDAIDSVEQLTALPLAVSNSDPTTTKVNIPPGIERHFDLVHVRKREVEEGDHPTVILEVIPKPVDTSWRVEASRFSVHLVVAAANADARRYSIEVAFDHSWPKSEDEVFDHLVVSSPRRRG